MPHFKCLLRWLLLTCTSILAKTAMIMKVVSSGFAIMTLVCHYNICKALDPQQSCQAVLLQTRDIHPTKAT